MKILGLSAYYHDSAAALIIDGVIVSAAQEERFTRVKHDSSFPRQSVEYCLNYSNVVLSEIDYVIFYDKPFLKFERLLETYLSFAPKGFLSFIKSFPVWIREKLFQKDLLIEELKFFDQGFNHDKKLRFSEHHFSHAASAYYPSPFDKAIVLTMDGVGEWVTSSVSIGNGSNLEIVREMKFPHSLGLLYSAFTYYAGFKVNSGEYKLMGLAPYGSPVFEDLILNNIVDLKDDGSFELNQSYFNYCAGLTMTNNKFANLFGRKSRKEGEEITQFHMDIASSIQSVTEKIVLKIVESLRNEFGIENLCMAGGVALNCVSNGKILSKGLVKNLWVQPSAGDAGGAIGAALGYYHQQLKFPRVFVGSGDGMSGGYLGPSFDAVDTEERLLRAGAKFKRFDYKEVIKKTVEALDMGKAVGWMQGRMEFGPRALGSRSILGDPRSPSMQKILNLKVKYRESFRPFAPAILNEHLKEWFDIDSSSPYMLLVANIKEKHRLKVSQKDSLLFGIDKLNIPKSTVPAVTHVDYSSRIQTIHKETNPIFYELLSGFNDQTGCPMLVNTSFNVRGEPIVCTPEDAFRCFMGTDLDILVVGTHFMTKEDQDPSLKLNYKNQFELD
jgi:carbamoyltransferase